MLRPHITIRPNETLVQCAICHKTHSIKVSDHKVNKWLTGWALIQNVMPDVSPSDRELLISGTCATCFDALFPQSTFGPDE